MNRSGPARDAAALSSRVTQQCGGQRGGGEAAALVVVRRGVGGVHGSVPSRRGGKRPPRSGRGSEQAGEQTPGTEPDKLKDDLGPVASPL